MNGVSIVAHRGRGAISKLIAWQTRSYPGYSHISLVLPDGRQIEAWTDGVHVREAFDPHDSECDVFAVEATDAQIAEMVKFALDQVGAKYDWWGDACFVTRMHPRESDTRWFCSELAFAVLEAGGVKLFRDTKAWEVSPGMLVRSPLLR